tara:strand:+ start:87 stop:638 length:552 start_codon:yes stop_codon:yes gene_type:complete
VHEGRAVIAVLGPRESSPDGEGTELSSRLGNCLAAAGYGIALVGAGPGPATAASSALAAGGRVIGFAGPDMPVPDLDQDPGTFEIRRHTSYFAALEATLELSDAVMVIDPDLSALAALLHVWSYGQTLEGPYQPLVLLGDAWPKVVKSIADAAGLDRRTRAMVTFAATPEEAVEALRYYVQPG